MLCIDTDFFSSCLESVVYKFRFERISESNLELFNNIIRYSASKKFFYNVIHIFLKKVHKKVYPFEGRNQQFSGIINSANFAYLK
ncbi:NgoFVII family restriction endonuclease [Candidatus Gracilibacteria bacterium]|nr:NgoFVII family restriction endonuclease [Candidatus Gracilibacteria bacterium]